MFDFLVISESGSINPSNSIRHQYRETSTNHGWILDDGPTGLGSPWAYVLVSQESIRAGLGRGDSTKN